MILINILQVVIIGFSNNINQNEKNIFIFVGVAYDGMYR